MLGQRCRPHRSGGCDIYQDLVCHDSEFSNGREVASQPRDQFGRTLHRIVGEADGIFRMILDCVESLRRASDIQRKRLRLQLADLAVCDFKFDLDLQPAYPDPGDSGDEYDCGNYPNPPARENALPFLLCARIACRVGRL